MRADEYWRTQFQGWVRQLGVAGTVNMESACAIAKRCMGAETALKRLADAAERELQEAPLPRLTAAEIERLAMLAEECGEVQQAVGKILRHGYESKPPRGGLTNRVALEREIGDVHAVMELMQDAGDTRAPVVNSWRNEKRLALRRWTHHQGNSAQRTVASGQ
jgi:NTP pyrophosphatase (non-canonical NTP hydrolase)